MEYFGRFNSRRDFVKSLICIFGFLYYPSSVSAKPLLLQNVIKKEFGSRKIRKGRVIIKIPRLAETGDSVPLSLKVNNPTIDENHVQQIYIFAEKNNEPLVMKARIAEKVSNVDFFTNIRLATSQRVLVVAEMQDNTLWSSIAKVEVTRSDCG